MKRIIGYVILALIFPMVFGLIGCFASNLTFITGLIIGIVIDCVVLMFGLAMTMIDSNEKDKIKK
jgi:hypothetical protein